MSKVCEEKLYLQHREGYLKKRQVLVVGAPLLRGTEAPISQPNRESQKVCYLLGAKI